MNTLFLTTEEQKVFQALPDKLREGWTMEVERLTAYETVEELAMRQKMASFDEFPQIALLAKQVSEGSALEKLSLHDVPQEVLPELCFTIGATGLTVLMAKLLSVMQNDEDLEGLMGLSLLRHEMLLSNAAIT
ncbi:hypothetical protein AUJ46_01520 [Candidatus Peregrinibacteria bacterium CG1_02_54_53]|nr:MAG: hypothetical protein AUJ46_01520 [Candidatus Peregrinibacteria bacterium CG1_02_54_53]